MVYARFMIRRGGAPESWPEVRTVVIAIITLTLFNTATEYYALTNSLTHFDTPANTIIDIVTHWSESWSQHTDRE